MSCYCFTYECHGPDPGCAAHGLEAQRRDERIEELEAEVRDLRDELRELQRAVSVLERKVGDNR